MERSHYRWSSKQIRKHVEVLDGIDSPHIVLKNATYLNSYIREWAEANIWIYDDRIVYVGEKLPKSLEQCEVIDCGGQFLVPGYIEPHSHPYQLYNPHTLATYAAQAGTTTLINDNLLFFFRLEREVAFELLEDFQNIPTSMYWWCRFDGQTELPNGDQIFNNEDVLAWLQHKAVLQGGELTAWPKLLNGDDQMLSWIQETKRLKKKVEGHFPGASESTLAKLMLLGADCDHEAMTGKEALTRLMQGYTVSLRNSSIRPDLENILKDLLELGLQQFDKFFFTTDGSHPFFYEDGMNDAMIAMAIEAGVPLIDAYNMATVNIARYYNFEHLHGTIATGRIANINILDSKENPTPVSVLAKGKWVKKDGNSMNEQSVIKWDHFGITPIQLEWNLQQEDLQFAETSGMELVNDVIAKPYTSTINLDCDEISSEYDECFFMMIARDGTWRINTLVKGFAQRLSGFASSYSGTGDIILIGKSKEDMVCAFNRMKEIGGGIVIVEEKQILHEIFLPLSGIMSTLDMQTLIQEEKKMIKLLQERGYQYNDPSFTLTFFSATHLPFIRVTPSGLFDVKNGKVIAFPIDRDLHITDEVKN
ncbi:adenine deaminase C-terminal domain-containing protein [Bacillus massiliigorillae]|uniref:adenine deaminase C-terminal domain-containing protein n=1 Tax=Bacillus massiliigorillae TaxID=1243664 RepID=UPI00039C839B|nr:adenine deaminase C-terminal domain-containing protein [Bacillus massiliigorillae]